MSAETPERAVSSRVSVEAAELNGDETGWTEAGIFVDRDGETDPELAEQVLLLNHGELRAVYDGLRLYYGQGIWSFRTVGPLADDEREPKPAPDLAAAMDPDKLDLLADWFDHDDAIRERLGNPEVQADLRRWAKAVRDHRERAGLTS